MREVDCFSVALQSNNLRRALYIMGRYTLGNISSQFPRSKVLLLLVLFIIAELILFDYFFNYFDFNLSFKNFFLSTGILLVIVLIFSIPIDIYYAFKNSKD